MDEIHQSIKEVQRCNMSKTGKIANLIKKLQVQRDTDSVDLVLYGIALGIKKISDHRIYDQGTDARLNELSERIQEIENREGLEEGEFFRPGDPDTPEDYQALNIEFKHRIDEINAETMREFGEDDMAELFMNNREGFIRRYHNGWRVLQKDNPEALKEIDEQENEGLREL